MSDKAAIPPSPSEDDYVRQVAAAEPPPLLSAQDPFALFAEWMKEAVAKEPNDANGMSLANNSGTQLVIDGGIVTNRGYYLTGTSSIVIVNRSPGLICSAPFTNRPSRIFGPCRSAKTPIGRPASSAAWRTALRRRR